MEPPRTPRALTQPRSETSGKLDRRDALGAMFHALDANNDGRVDFDEACTAACGVCATMTAREALDWFTSLDTSDTGFVDEQEYVLGMLTLTKPFTDLEFANAVKDTIHRTRKKVKHPRYYFHENETSAREYLGRELTPLLEQGLDSLLKEVETERLKMASGELWDADGYAPNEWRALRPLQFLGKYLIENSEKGIERRKAHELEREKSALKAKEKAAFEARGGKPPPFAELTRTEKIKMCFSAIDKNNDGYLTFDEMLHVCKKIDPGRGREEASSTINWMDKNGDNAVDIQEYETAMMEMMEHVDDEVFDLGCQKILDAVMFAESNRDEKLKMVFDKTDIDGNGTLDVDELTTLAKQLIPGGDEAAVKRTLKWLDVNNDNLVSFEEFLVPMLQAVVTLDDDRFDACVRKILELDGDAKEDDASTQLHPKLAAHVDGMSTHTTTTQITVSTLDLLLKDSNKRIAIVDCRTEAERNVSTLDYSSRGSVSSRTTVHVILGDVAFVDAVDNNLAALVDSFDLSEIADCDTVVCVSATGAEAGVVAPLIQSKLDNPDGEAKENEETEETENSELPKPEKLKSDCRNLCGGVIAWFNAGYGMLDPSTGTGTEAVHPGLRNRIGLVRPRKNQFRFPKEGEEGAGEA